MPAAPAAQAPPLPPARLDSFDVERPVRSLDVATALRRIAAERGASHLDLVRDYVGLAFGPGRLSFGEYVAMRLFEDLPSAEKRRFVGAGAWLKILADVNYRRDWWGLVAHKIASTAFLSAYGFPTIPVLAIYRAEAAPGQASRLSGEAELRAFLADPRNYPLFGKPVEGFQSLGSASLEGYDPASRSLRCTTGQTVRLDAFLADVAAHYGSGYLFQKRVAPHPEVRALCGDRLATVRVLTLRSEGTPKLFRACWKIPAGRNAADNFWRPGNLLARIDLVDGRVVRALRGTGMDLEVLSRHPDSGTPLAGLSVPDWPAIATLAVEGARLLKDVPLLGWDIAPTETGPVIVEVNETPDCLLPQLADRRGLLDAEFLSFMAEQKRRAAAWKREQAAQARAALRT